jgi:hypothetical protein
MFKIHNTSHLKTFPFKKMKQLHSPWTRLAVNVITLKAPLFDLGLGQSFK